MFSEIKTELAKNKIEFMLPEGVTDEENLHYCDYYEKGQGY
jgi:hypothetical protein